MGPVAVRNHSAEVSKSVARVLLLEHDAARLEKLLAQPEAEFQVQPATIHSPAEIDSALNSREIAAVILDCTGAARGLDETCAHLRANWPETPFILLLEGPEEEAVAESERLGAADFVLLENTTRLVFAVKCALEERKLRKENARLQLKLQYSEKCLQDLVEHSVYGIFHAGMDGKFVSANETLQKILVCSNFDELQQLNLAELDPPALAVLDVVMPNMGGAAAAELLRRDPALPVLFTSGFSENANTAVAGAPGSHYLQKPYSPTSLASMIREILDS